MVIDYDILFVSVDDFCKGFEPWYQKQFIFKGLVKRRRKSNLTLSEVLTILIAYHQSGMACFKYFYLDVSQHSRHLFPTLVHYDHFISLIKRAFPALVCLLKSLRGEVTEYLFIDSTCHNKREKQHKVFKGLAAKGKTSVGFFFDFKLHMIFNIKGELIRLFITSGNVDDRKPVSAMAQGIAAKLISDKWYLSHKLFNELFKKGITLITKIKKNMKNRLMDVTDKMMLMRRSFIETIFSSLKSLNTLIHHRHRCPINGLANLIAGLIHYQLRPDKPTFETFTKIYS